MTLDVSSLGVVAIGRNEGERLKRCLRSVPPGVLAVYVDSASTDDSVSFARGLGVEVIELDMTIPFTAARARNTGIQRLLSLRPNLQLVQVVDGDCEIEPGWLEAALVEIGTDPNIAAVSGRRREVDPDASFYNRLCDMEWEFDLPYGDSKSCGGDALIRVSAWRTVHGYDESLIAGEEPELSLRLRRAGYRIRRIRNGMTVHDARMTSFRQWWRRSQRSGHAYAELAHMHGRSDDRFCVDAVRSIVKWTVVPPTVAAAVLPFSRVASLGALSLYGVLWNRIRAQRQSQGAAPADAALYAAFCVAGKFPQMVGVLQFHANRLRGQRSRLIEYKGPRAAAP